MTNFLLLSCKLLTKHMSRPKFMLDVRLIGLNYNLKNNLYGIFTITFKNFAYIFIAHMWQKVD